MRAWSLFVVCLLAFVLSARGDDKAAVIGPADAAKKVNEQVTLEMEVKSATLRGTTCFLNSEKDFRDPKNLTLFIDKDALAKFKDAKIDDPAAHFKGKTVRVEGKVILYRDKPEIKLSGPDAIKIVGKQEAQLDRMRPAHDREVSSSNSLRCGGIACDAGPRCRFQHSRFSGQQLHASLRHFRQHDCRAVPSLVRKLHRLRVQRSHARLDEPRRSIRPERGQRDVSEFHLRIDRCRQLRRHRLSRLHIRWKLVDDGLSAVGVIAVRCGLSNQHFW